MTSGSALASWLVPVLVVPCGVVGLWAALTYCTGRHSVENAPYKVLRVLSAPPGRGGSGRVQLRAYPASLIAAVDVTGEPNLGRAQSRGFRAVAGYIFGANLAPPAAGAGAPGAGAGASEAVAMTAPVLTQALPASVAMTAPVVTQALAASGEAAGGGAGDGGGGGAGYRIAFVMPSKYASLESLPVPTNPAVRLLAQPPRLELVESRTGLYPDAAARDAAVARLSAVAQREGLQLTEGVLPSVYNFDPPWALPMMRLSEVAVRVDDDGRVGEASAK